MLHFIPTEELKQNLDGLRLDNCDIDLAIEETRPPDICKNLLARKVRNNDNISIILAEIKRRGECCCEQQ